MIFLVILLGGQILHRFALFYNSKKVKRILSSNSGWYTVPNFEAKFPTGLIDTPITEGALKATFPIKLVVFLGELDNESEERGHLVKNQRMNVQGLHRLERGNFFILLLKRKQTHKAPVLIGKKLLYLMLVTIIKNERESS